MTQTGIRGVLSLDCSCGLVHDDDLPTTEELHNKVLDALGGKCASSGCRWLNEDGSLGCKDRKLLHVDHVYNNGTQDRRSKKNRSTYPSYWKEVLKAIESGSDEYQILCANCNWLKRNYSASAWKKKFLKKAIQ